MDLKNFKPKRKDVLQLPLYMIEVEEGFNPRKDYGDIDSLAKSIAENGMKNPMRGYKLPEGKYLLTDGHRRLRASQQNQDKNPDVEILVPFIIDKDEKSPEQRVIDVLVCNDGKKLNPIEEAEVINRLVNFGMSEKDIAKKTGLTTVYISNLKLLYNAPTKVKNHITSNMVSATLAMAVLRDTKNYDEAVKTIEKGVEYAKSKGKKKVVKRDLDKAQGKVNSYSALGKCFKAANKEERVVRKDKQELYEFSHKILNGELTREQLEEMFFEPKSE